MSKRYRERLEQVDVAPTVEPHGAGRPRRFRWRGRDYRVVRVLGHWREETGWWKGAGDRPAGLQQADRWRVEATGRRGPHGVYELVCRGGTWHLDRVWD